MKPRCMRNVMQNVKLVLLSFMASLGHPLVISEQHVELNHGMKNHFLINGANWKHCLLLEVCHLEFIFI